MGAKHSKSNIDRNCNQKKETEKQENPNMATQYVHDDSGTYIPATQRPDGSWRKARRVKDGYIPQDEMPLYESKGKQFAKSQPQGPVGLDPSYMFQPESIIPSHAPRKIPGLDDNELTETVAKSTKKKKKKKGGASKDPELSNEMEKLLISPKFAEGDASTTSQTDPLKRLRNLRKKLKEINALQAKITSGELKNPEKDQLDKISRKSEVEMEIQELLLEVDD